MTTIAIIQSGSRQYRVSKDSIFEVEKLNDVKKGDTVTFDQVLLVTDGKSAKVGAPTVSGATVTAEVLEPAKKGAKTLTVKTKPKKRMKRTLGHRQTYTVVKVTKL